MKPKRRVFSLTCAALSVASLFLIAGCKDKEGGTENLPQGEFFTLQQAYDNGLITEKDIQEISYRMWGSVYVVGENETEWKCNENWTKLDYTSTTESDELDNKIESDILGSYYANHINRFFDEEGNKRGGVEDLSIRNFGEYNGLYAVQIDSCLWSYPADVFVERYGNTVIYQTRCPVLIFQYLQ